jgi:Zn-dependent peptidase ImmA (M78 family)/transcriptional regulator with XRE-family HTH domain
MAITRDEIATRIRKLLSAQGVEQRALAAAIDLDPSAMSRALSGQRDFKSVEIAHIAHELGVPVGYLLEETPRELDEVRLAARVQPMQNPAVEKAIERANLLVSVARLLPEAGGQAQLDDLIELPQANNPWEQGEELAKRVRARMNNRTGVLPSSPEKLASLLEEGLGIDVAMEPLPHGLDGLSIACDSLQLALVSTYSAVPRQRWTIAHELGHLVAGDAQELRVDENLFSSRSKEETRANAFAAAFLLPEDDIKASWARSNKSVDAVAELLETYGVSLDALAFRLHNVGSVNAEGRDRIRAMWRGMGRVRSEATAERETARVPGHLTQRAIDAYVHGRLGVRPLAALLRLDADEFLDLMQPSEEEAFAMSAADSPLSA